MRIYELALVLNSTLSEGARKKMLDTVKALIKEMKITKEDAWGEKALSYAIKGQRSGYYFLMSLEGESIPLDFEKKLVEQDNILRHLLIRKK